MKLIKLLVQIVWASIGLIFWIPFLVRVILICVIRLFIDSILILKTDSKKLSDGLTKAAQFYYQGFKDF